MEDFTYVIALIASIIAKSLGSELVHYSGDETFNEMWQYDGYDDNNGFLIQCFKGKANLSCGGGDHISMTVDTSHLSYNLSHPTRDWEEEYAQSLSLLLQGKAPW